jgi:hypothetical protein
MGKISLTVVAQIGVDIVFFIVGGNSTSRTSRTASVTGDAFCMDSIGHFGRMGSRNKFFISRNGDFYNSLVWCSPFYFFIFACF